MANPKGGCGGRTTHTPTANSPLSSVSLRKYVYLRVFTLTPSLSTGWLFPTGDHTGLWGSSGHILEESECLRCCFESSHFRRLYIYSKNVSPGPELLGGPGEDASAFRAAPALHRQPFFSFLLTPNSYTHAAYQAGLWMTYGSFQKSLNPLPSMPPAPKRMETWHRAVLSEKCFAVSEDSSTRAVPNVWRKNNIIRVSIWPPSENVLKRDGIPLGS